MKDDDDLEEFKDCPFCGGKPQVYKHHRQELWSLVHRCPVAGVITLPMEWWDTRQAPVKRWNTRRGEPKCES